MSKMPSLLERNQHFASTFTPVPRGPPNARVLVVTCLDHRVDPAVTVAADVNRLRSSAAISPRVTVSGHVYDVDTGLVKTVVPAPGTRDGSRR